MENSTNETAGRVNQSPFLIPMAIIVAGVIVAGAVVYTGAGGKIAKPDQNLGNTLVSASDEAKTLLTVTTGDFVLGDPGAKVTVVEFADFQCPFCGRFFKTTIPSLKENYVKTGAVRFVFRDFAFLGEESTRAAEAARCAGDQNKFWEYHDYLYNHQKGENQGAFSDANLKKFADTLKLDRAVFDACFDSEKYRPFVERETKLGQELGVSGTPTTFVDGEAIVGAIPFADIEKKIQAALAK